jgi:hypothetical protein
MLSRMIFLLYSFLKWLPVEVPTRGYETPRKTHLFSRKDAGTVQRWDTLHLRSWAGVRG